MNLELWAATVESVAIRGQDTSLGDVEESDAAEALLALEESYRHGLEWHNALVPLVLASRRALGTGLSLPVDVIRHVRSYLCEYMM